MSLRINFAPGAEKAFNALPHEAYLSACGQLAVAAVNAANAPEAPALQRYQSLMIDAVGFRVTYFLEPHTSALTVVDVCRTDR